MYTQERLKSEFDEACKLVKDEDLEFTREECELAWNTSERLWKLLWDANRRGMFPSDVLNKYQPLFHHIMVLQYTKTGLHLHEKTKTSKGGKCLLCDCKPNQEKILRSLQDIDCESSDQIRELELVQEEDDDDDEEVRDDTGDEQSEDEDLNDDPVSYINRVTGFKKRIAKRRKPCVCFCHGSIPPRTDVEFFAQRSKNLLVPTPFDEHISTHKKVLLIPECFSSKSKIKSVSKSNLFSVKSLTKTEQQFTLVIEKLNIDYVSSYVNVKNIN
jgi:hypothetical protein